MVSWRKALILLALLSAVALLGPTSALASGSSAGDQQYVDPLGGSTGTHHSHSTTSTSGSTSPPPVATPTPTATPPTATVTPATVTTTSTTPTATTSGSTSTAPTRSSNAKSAGDPQTLPMTGFDAWLVAAIGLGLTASGMSLRRAARRS
jgi:hypothetical protein